MAMCDIPLWLSIIFLAGGLAALAWSSDVFVDGAAALARSLGISPFVIGMVVIGFGTSAPELCVSTLSGVSGHSNLSVGNAYGSCVFNIAVILGIAAAIRPIAVKPFSAISAGLILGAISAGSWFLLRDGTCSRPDAYILLAAFAVVMTVYCLLDQKSAAAETSGGADAPSAPLLASLAKTLFGLVVLVGSSHFLVWGAVDLARVMGVGELAIGLTIVAGGTSLPELASAIAASRKGQSDFVLGNIVGSNIFNTLAVVGLASAIQPATGFSGFVLSRDIPCMLALSLSIAVFGLNRSSLRETTRIGRIRGIVWILSFAVYFAFVFAQECMKSA